MLQPYREEESLSSTGLEELLPFLSIPHREGDGVDAVLELRWNGARPLLQLKEKRQTVIWQRQTSVCELNKQHYFERWSLSPIYYLAYIWPLSIYGDGCFLFRGEKRDCWFLSVLQIRGKIQVRHIHEWNYGDSVFHNIYIIRRLMTEGESLRWGNACRGCLLCL